MLRPYDSVWETIHLLLVLATRPPKRVVIRRLKLESIIFLCYDYCVVVFSTSFSLNCVVFCCCCCCSFFSFSLVAIVVVVVVVALLFSTVSLNMWCELVAIEIVAIPMQLLVVGVTIFCVGPVFPLLRQSSSHCCFLKLLAGCRRVDVSSSKYCTRDF